MLVLLFSTGASLGSSPTSVVPPPGPTAPSSLAAPHVGSAQNYLAPPTVASHLGPTPLATTNGTFYQNYTIPAVATAKEFCSPSAYSYHYCYPDDQDPSALRLANGDIGLAFSRMTNQTTNSCTNATNDTVIRVGFSLSSNSGHTFGTPTLIGNETCPYIQSMEPSFGVSSSGAVYGTFVEANVTAAQLYPYYYYAGIIEYTTRSSDALGFVSSANNGTTFSNVTTIKPAGNANIARPALATFGKTVYIVYDNISNGTSYLNATTSTPISVNLVYSNDGGVTWHGPYVLPGLDTTEFNTSMAPSIAVNKTGMVAVAYATYRHCVGYCNWPSYGIEYGDSIVVATSTSNGTAWSGPHYVSKDTGVGESGEYYGGYALYRGGPWVFEETPQTSIAFSASGTTMYVAWAGTQNRSTGDYYYDWTSARAYSAVSTNGGSTFAIAAVSGNTSSTLPPYYESAYTPAIAVAPSGTVYYTYTFYNQSYSSSCGGSVSPLAYAYYQSIVTSPNGLTWSSPSITEIWANGYASYNNIGHLASITFNATGVPVVAYSLIKPYYFSSAGTQYHYNYPVAIQVATPWTGSTVALTIDENNLTAGTQWGISVDGQTFTTTGSNLTITNIPYGVPIVISATPQSIPNGYRSEFVGSFFGITAEPTLYLAKTAYLNYSLYYGIAFQPDPKNLGYVYIEITNYSRTPYLYLYYYWDSFGSYYYEGGNCPQPWYMPAGTKLHMTETYSYPVASYIYAPVPISFWNGTGSGSYTGPGSQANLTVSGPFNQTFWAQSYGVYNETVQSIGLPSTSVYHFTWDGTTYSASAGTTVQVPRAETGIHHVSDVWANSSTSGWEYIGTLPNQGDVPVPDEPTVNLTFAYVDVGAAMGSVSFQASGLTAGTIWHFKLNGTEYGSSTPWINITTHSGTYSEAGYPVVSANGSVDYAPLSLSPTISVTTGSTYTISYSRAYELTVVAGAGGHVSPAPGTSWKAPNASATFSASPNAGYLFLGWSGTGTGSYTGTSANATVTMFGPIVETANFAPLIPNRFNLTFNDGGSLPNGTWWTVYVNGVGYSSNNGTIVVPHVYSCAVSGSLGRYTINVPYAYLNSSDLTRYTPASYLSTVCGDTVDSITFNVQYFLTLESTAGGTVTATDASQASSTGLWASPSDLVSLQATPSNGYLFLGWNGTGSGNYTGTINPQSISLSGPVTELGSFTQVVIPPPPRYNVDFHLSAAFGDGTVWTVTMNGTTYASSGTDLIVSGLLAHTYTVSVAAVKSPDGQTLYTPVGAPSSLNVVANQTVTLSYKTSYWVSVDVSGAGAASIQVGSTNATSGWYASGATITLNATASSPWLFSGWTGTGSGSYSGPQSSYSIQVKGPVHEVATFVPPAPATKVITSTWTSPMVWAGLAVAGLVVGLVVGLLVARMRKGGRA